MNKIGAESMTNRQQYLEYIQAATLTHRASYDSSIEAWRKAFKPNEFLGMYSPPGFIPIQLQLEGYMYKVTGDLSYAEEAKKLMLAMVEFQSIVPEEIRRRHPEYENGIPAFEPMFQGPHVMQGYLDVKDSGVFSPEERAQAEQAIRSMVSAIYHFAEWGAHNRSMLRAQVLSLAIEALGDSEETREWAKLRDYLAQASIGNWSIEDAELYIPLWLSSCMTVAERTGTERSYYAKPQTKYYFDYVVNLLTPYGQIPDFGDASHSSWWYLWLAVMERGAVVYRCGHMKYAANLVFDFAMAAAGEEPNAYLAAFFTYAHRWMEEEIEPVRPDWKSGEALEDAIGKKIVFRSGWEKDAAYMLLNYRDEGDFSKVTRDYMLLTVNAPAEKVHHGHADENSISLLASRQNILLHDGGYRDGAPNGRYRADLYHNRLVFRDGRPEPGIGMFDYLHDDGRYHRVSTQKLHFQSFGEIVYSRTRVDDPYRGFLWDRAVIYLPDDEAYLVVDWAEVKRDGERTIVNVWHPSTVLEAGDGRFIGQVRTIFQGVNDPKPFKNRTDMALLIEFPGSDRPNGQETIRRCYTESEMVFEQDTVRTAGDRKVFVTALSPYARGDGEAAPAGRVESVEAAEDQGRLRIVYRHSGRTIIFCLKLDLALGALDQADYPKYSWEQGKLAYGNVNTDADFAFVMEQDGAPGRYGYINGCGIEYGGNVLHRTPIMSGYSFENKTYKPVDHRWRAWDGMFARDQGNS